MVPVIQRIVCLQAHISIKEDKELLDAFGRTRGTDLHFSAEDIVATSELLCKLASRHRAFMAAWPDDGTKVFDECVAAANNLLTCFSQAQQKILAEMNY